MTERIAWLDSAKVITAFLVVYTHLYTSDDPFRLWIYTFHMPLFFLISGYFHKEKKLSQSVKDNFYRLIVPAFFFIVFGLITYTFIYGLKELPACIESSLQGVILGNTITANNVIWFIFALFWDNILLNLIIRYRWFWVFISILYVVSITPHFNSIRLIHLSQALFSMPFYVLGYIAKRLLTPKFSMLQIFKKKQFYVLGGVVFLFLSIFLSKINSDVSMHFCIPGNANFWIRYPLFYLNGLIGSMFILCLSKCMPIVNLEFVSRGLISILGGQFLFMLIYDNYIGRNQNYLFSLIVALIIMTICIKMHYIFIKHAPFLVGQFKNKK